MISEIIVFTLRTSVPTT